MLFCFVIAKLYLIIELTKRLSKKYYINDKNLYPHKIKLMFFDHFNYKCAIYLN